MFKSLCIFFVIFFFIKKLKIKPTLWFKVNHINQFLLIWLLCFDFCCSKPMLKRSNLGKDFLTEFLKEQLKTCLFGLRFILCKLLLLLNVQKHQHPFLFKYLCLSFQKIFQLQQLMHFWKYLFLHNQAKL